jgi:hypothetical protein
MLEERLVEAEIKEGIRTSVYVYILMISVFVKAKKEKRRKNSQEIFCPFYNVRMKARCE